MRQVDRLKQRVADLEKLLARERRQAEVDKRQLDWQLDNANATVKVERYARLCAQQWIAEHYRTMGQESLIGYEPKADPVARAFMENPGFAEQSATATAARAAAMAKASMEPGVADAIRAVS